MCDIISTTVFSNRLLEAFLWMLAAFLYHDDPTLLSGGQSYDSVFYPCFHCTGGAFGITAEKRSCCQAGSFQMVLDGGWWDISASSLPEERLLLPLRPFLASASTSAVLGSYFNSTLTAYAPVASDSLKTLTLTL